MFLSLSKNLMALLGIWLLDLGSWRWQLGLGFGKLDGPDHGTVGYLDSGGADRKYGELLPVFVELWNNQGKLG